MNINKEDLIKLLKEVRGNTFISVECETEPKLLGGRSCPYKGIRKISKVAGAIGFNYTNSVNNQREREDLDKDFEAEPRAWGTRLKGTPLVEHKGKTYIEVKVQSTESPLYVLNGKFIPNEDIKPYIPETKSRQGVDKEIIVRDYDISNIRSIKIKGQQFVVSAETKVEADV
jgi:hypothetical protein